MENIEGGLAYVQDVIINDSLGINEALEEQMAAIIGTYQCEWKTTIEDPEALKRFKPFVNSTKTDSNIQFVTEREQIRPARGQEKIAVTVIEPADELAVEV
jgi:nitrite reductase (NADH) large subunit